MSRRPTARASACRFASSLEGLRGKEVRRGQITCSIFTLDPPGASAHSHRTSSDFASEGYKVHLCMQQQNASATNFFTPRNGALPSLVRPQGNDPKSPQPLLPDSKRQPVASPNSSGTSTIMTPSTSLPSFTAKAVTRPVPSDSSTLSLTSCPPVISTLRPLALAPVADKLLTATVADWINTSYVPGGTA